MAEDGQQAKRALEAEPEASQEEQVQAAKKQKTAEPGSGEAEAAAAPSAAAAAAAGDEQAGAEAAAADGAEDAMDEEAAAGADDAEADAPPAAAAAAAAGGGVKLGYRTFRNAQEVQDYLHEVLKQSIPHRKLNEYESVLLLDLLQKGHPHAEQKLAGGVRAFVVAERHVGGHTTSCFHIRRLDNTLEDFSYRKCLPAFFPDYVVRDLPPRRDGGGRGRGGRGGRFGGSPGRGSGGRGRGGRFGSSPGRGRGGRGRW